MGNSVIAESNTLQAKGSLFATNGSPLWLKRADNAFGTLRLLQSRRTRGGQAGAVQRPAGNSVTLTEFRPGSTLGNSFNVTVFLRARS